MHFDFFEQYQAKQKAYEEAKQLVNERLVPVMLSTERPYWVTACRALEQVEQAKKNIFSGIPLEVLTEILELTANGLSMDLAPEVCKPLFERYSTIFTKLKTINTKESMRLQAIIAGIVGLILIAACIALSVLTAGITAPFFVFFAIVIGKVLLGASGIVLGAASSYYLANNMGSDINGLVDEKNKMLDELQYDDPLYSEFKQVLDGDFLTANNDAIAKKNRGDCSRIFNALLMTSISNRKAYNSLIKASKEGTIGVHLQHVAKSMSRAFLDENHNLLPAIKEKLEITECSQQEEQQIVGQLLQATIALYSMAATAHSADVPLEVNHTNNLTSIACVCDVYNKAIITVDYVFSEQKPAWHIPTKKLIEDFIDVFKKRITSLKGSENLSDEQQKVFKFIIDKLDNVSSNVLNENLKFEEDKAVTSEQKDEFAQVKNIEACLTIEREIKPKIEAAMKMVTVSEEQKAILQEMIDAYHRLAIKNNLGDVPGSVFDVGDDVAQQLRY